MAAFDGSLVLSANRLDLPNSLHVAAPSRRPAEECGSFYVSEKLISGICMGSLYLNE
jgi:hypothetical protein